jgi:hypothetical protein
MEMPKSPGRCPVCGKEFTIKRLECEACGTGMDGSFRACRFCQLSGDQMAFLEVFLASRGVIKEAEKALGVSYPTVKGRLEYLLAALGLRGQADQDEDAGERGRERQKAIDALDQGLISVSDALKILKKV